MQDLAARIRLAEAYPYERPRHSYLFVDGEARPLGEPPSSARVPVIAAGSNAAPARLAAKFAGWSAAIPVTRATLHDHAVVYAAHFSSYGAVPATLHPAPGARSEVFVTWLTADELAHMHTTEGVGVRYDYVELSGLRLEVEGHGSLAQAGAYLARNGALTVDRRPVRLGAVPGQRCGFAACAHVAILQVAHRRLARRHSYQTFMSQVIACADYRRRASTTLARTAARWHRTDD